MKKLIIAVFLILVLALGVFLFFNRSQKINQEQILLEAILSISKEYITLRYKTDNVLIMAKSFENYNEWNKEILDIIEKWESLEKNASTLKKLAGKMAEEKINFNFISQIFAYNKQEISAVFDKAPAGKKIKTLANFLGVDAKKAFQILKQDQAQVEADAWNEAGDTFQFLENQAIVIKNASKITVFVGTIALTGGTAAIVSGSALSQAAVVVSGADLTLEITDDAAKIALGDKNKISTIVGDARKITEPAGAILMVSTLPTNLVKGIDKLSAVVFGADQLNSTIQSGSVIGIKLPIYEKNKSSQNIEVSVLEKKEMNEWLKEQGISDIIETTEEIEKILEINQLGEFIDIIENSTPMATSEIEIEKDKEQVNYDNNSQISGVWEGLLRYTPSQTSGEIQTEYIIKLNNDGIVSDIGNGKVFSTWIKEGNKIKLFFKENSESYYEFALSEEALTFTKLAGVNSEGEWQEDFAGEDFFGGKFYEILLNKQ